MNPPPFRTLEEHIESLKSRGMSFGNEAAARRALETIGAWRLRQYWYRFEERSTEATPRNFVAGTSFEKVHDVYEFDRNLKLAVFAAVERVEVSLRAVWVRAMYREFGLLGYASASLYVEPREHRNRRRLLKKRWAKDKRKDPIAKKHDDRYGPLAIPPVHLAADSMSFGELIGWMDGLDTGGHRTKKQVPGTKIRNIATDFKRTFTLPYPYIVSAGRHLRHVRNIAAHHSRLWDRAIAYNMLADPKRARSCLRDSMKITEPIGDFGTVERTRQGLYRTLTLLVYLSNVISATCRFRSDVLNLIDLFEPPLQHMAFPDDWSKRPVWQNDPACYGP